MPEGHSLRRLALQWGRLVGQKLTITSPQGRFQGPADELSGLTLLGTEAHGKHLFLEFEGERFVHVHLGLYGRFLWQPLPAPPPTANVRMRAKHAKGVVDLSGPTRCELLTREGKEAIHARLGPDPLHPEDTVEPLLAWASTSSWPIARTLMEQSKIAGIGNVYRAEILFMLALNPFTPTSELSREQWEELWGLSRTLLEAGVRHSGAIATTLKGLPEPATLPPGTACASRTYVYKRTKRPCVACGTLIKQEQLEGRRLYYCPQCQGVNTIV